MGKDKGKINTSRDLANYLANFDETAVQLNMRSIKENAEIALLLDKPNLESLTVKFIAMKSTKVFIKTAVFLAEELSKRPHIAYKEGTMKHSLNAPDVRIICRPVVLLASNLTSINFKYNSNKTPKLLFNLFVRHLKTLTNLKELVLELREDFKQIFDFVGRIAAKAHKDFKLKIEKLIKNAAAWMATSETVPYKDVENEEILPIVKHVIGSDRLYTDQLGPFLHRALFTRSYKPLYKKLYVYGDKQLIYADYGFDSKLFSWLRKFEPFRK